MLVHEHLVNKVRCQLSNNLFNLNVQRNKRQQSSSSSHAWVLQLGCNYAILYSEFPFSQHPPSTCCNPRCFHLGWGETPSHRLNLVSSNIYHSLDNIKVTGNKAVKCYLSLGLFVWCPSDRQRQSSQRQPSQQPLTNSPMRVKTFIGLFGESVWKSTAQCVFVYWGFSKPFFQFTVAAISA